MMVEKEAAVFNAIKQFIARYGCSPSYREIKEMAGLTSWSIVQPILESLQEQEYIKYTPGMIRSIRLVNPSVFFVEELGHRAEQIEELEAKVEALEQKIHFMNKFSQKMAGNK